MSQTKSTNSDQSVTADHRYLVFSLCDELYAVELPRVKEVIAMAETTPIPQAPSHFKGIMNLRGSVISIIDLRSKLKMSKADVGPETAIVILDLEPLYLGIVVNSVNSVVSLSPSEVSETPDIQLNTKKNFIQGVARKDEKLILLLDIAATLDVEDMKAIKSQQQNPQAA